MILLVVMALLTLLTLLGLTLVLATSQARLNALASARATAAAAGAGHADSVIDDVFDQVIRGTNDRDSVMQGHSLLEDLYGQPRLLGRVVAAPTPGANGQLLNMLVLPVDPNGNLLYNHIYPASGEYCGLVITMLNGIAQGRSARVVGHVYNPNPPPTTTLQVTSFDGLFPSVGDQFLLNGRPFSGTGFGFQAASFNPGSGFPTTQLLDSLELTPHFGPLWPYALLPNHARIQLGGGNTLDYTDVAGPTGVPPSTATPWINAGGGANEPYDAPDFQNMLLCLRLPNLPTAGKVFTALPSLHRPELIRYWMVQYATLAGWMPPSGANALTVPPWQFAPVDWYNGSGTGFSEMHSDIARRICLRPLPQDNPSILGVPAFTGSNASTGGQFDPLQPMTPGSAFVWDVDNDGDGDYDSIWVDVGLDAQTEADGSKSKWLAAVLCVEMDGKLNLNTAGNHSHLDLTRYGSDITGPFAGAGERFLTAGDTNVKTGTPNARNFPYGLATGTAEINPVYFFMYGVPGNLGQAISDLQFLTLGFVDNSSSVYIYLDGRYGEAERTNLNPIFTGTTYGLWVPHATPVAAFGEVTQAQSIYGLAHPLGNSVYMLGGPRAGLSQWYDPLVVSPVLGPGGQPVYRPYDWISLARGMQSRPYLLQPTTPGLPWSSGSGNPPGNWWFDFLYPGLTLTGHLHVASSYGTPCDPRARGVVGVDVAGRVVWSGTTTQPFMQAIVDPSFAGAQNDMPDNPYELDLSPNARQDGYLVNTPVANGGPGPIVTIDQSFLADDLEALLRWHDGDAKMLVSRIKTLTDQSSQWYQTVGAGTGVNWLNPPSPPPPALPPPTDAVRGSVTTESWNIPTLDVTAPDLVNVLSQDIATLEASTGVPTPVGGASIVDLLRARIIAENSTNGVINPGGPLGGVANGADVAMFGIPGAAWPILSNDLLMGLKLDINRALGNGIDDNGNFVVDEPQEVLFGTGEYVEAPLNPNLPLTPPTSLGFVAQVLMDHNNDGLYPPGAGGASYPAGTVYPPDATLADTRARQLLARQLYVLMMLLLDDRTLQANVFNTAALAANPWPRPMSPAPFPVIPLPLPPVPTPPSTPIPSLYTSGYLQAAYVVAQWAINAIDFRDADSIMTPFEFDVRPFFADDPTPGNHGITWNVDDIVDPTPASGGPAPYSKADDLATWRGLVFGCERPELLITETVATHDRATDDTNLAANFAGPTPPAGTTDTYTNANPNPDPNYDQVRRPRGTLMFELFNPNSSSDAPNELSGVTGNLSGVPLYPQYGGLTTGVNLTALAPANPVSGVVASVWRVAVAYSPNGYDGFTGGPTTPALDPRVPVLNPLYIHRVLYFISGAAMPPATNQVPEAPVYQRYFLSGATTGSAIVVPPGSYALVGPGVADPSTGAIGAYFGARNKAVGGVSGALASKKNAFPMHAVLWNPPGDAFTIGLFDSTTPTGAGMAASPYAGQAAATPNLLIKQVVGVPVGTNYYVTGGVAPQSGPAGATLSARFCLSEPEFGYPLTPTGGIPITDDDDFFYLGTPAGFKFPNTPYDWPFTAAGGPTAVGTPNSNGIVPNPNVAATGFASATISNYTTIYLQRLADPLAPWDQYANPYVIVDSMPVNLSTYSGESTNTVSGGATGGIEPTYKAAIAGPPPTTGTFDNLRRGQGAATDSPNVWRPLPVGAGADAVLSALLSKATGDPTPLIAKSLNGPWAVGSGFLGNSSLGYLNNEYGAYWNALNPAPVTTSAGGGVSLTLPLLYNGDPVTPFPWLAWNNRPYANQYELMLVPTSSPSSYLGDVGLLGWVGGGSTPMIQYDPGPSATLAPSIPPAPPFAQFRQLLNFYDGSVAGTNNIANVARILEFIHVPSPFAGTQQMLEATELAGANAGTPHLFHPPFNWLNQYREPGRVNLNTIVDPFVFQSVMDDYPGSVFVAGNIAPTSPPFTLWQQLVDSRRGYGVAGGVVNQSSYGVFPTLFANPFRPQNASRLVPLASMRQYISPTAPIAAYDVNATTLRAAGATLSAPGTLLPSPGGSLAMLDANTFDTTNAGASEIAPLPTAANAANLYRNAGRNPYFQYQPQQRLGSLTTNHSNVYAIWVTLGKFQATQVPVDQYHPDGYSLGAEIGFSTGDQQRPRAFYIYDRSIPVGFMRGEDLNMEKGVLIERVLND